MTRLSFKTSLSLFLAVSLCFYMSVCLPPSLFLSLSPSLFLSHFLCLSFPHFSLPLNTLTLFYSTQLYTAFPLSFFFPILLQLTFRQLIKAWSAHLSISAILFKSTSFFFFVSEWEAIGDRKTEGTKEISNSKIKEKDKRRKKTENRNRRKRSKRKRIKRKKIKRKRIKRKK